MEPIEHRRADGELVGWLRPEGEGFVVIDRLGRERTGALDWLSAEEALDAIGLAFLAEPWWLRRDDGSLVRVRIAELRPDVVRVREDDFGAAAAVGADVADHLVPFPPGERLRPWE